MDLPFSDHKDHISLDIDSTTSGSDFFISDFEEEDVEEFHDEDVKALNQFMWDRLFLVLNI